MNPLIYSHLTMHEEKQTKKYCEMLLNIFLFNIHNSAKLAVVSLRIQFVNRRRLYTIKNILQSSVEEATIVNFRVSIVKALLKITAEIQGACHSEISDNYLFIYFYQSHLEPFHGVARVRFATIADKPHKRMRLQFGDLVISRQMSSHCYGMKIILLGMQGHR